jgi:RNA polymerase sigma-70 factor (ECF subfamily)
VAAGPRRFHTTRWTLVLAAAGSRSPEADSALAALCETYWSPVFAFIRRSGHQDEDARDLTQAFFTRMLERSYLRAARPERGRFRSFLLASVRHFLSDARDRNEALKRGGGVLHVPITGPGGSDGLSVVDVPIGDTPEQAFERRWALATLDAAVSRVAVDYARAGKRTLFETLKPGVDGEDRLDYATVSAALNCTEGAARVAVHRLRRHVAAALRRTLAETVADERDVDDELRFLMAALRKA